MNHLMAPMETVEKSQTEVDKRTPLNSGCDRADIGKKEMQPSVLFSVYELRKITFEGFGNTRG